MKDKKTARSRALIAGGSRRMLQGASVGRGVPADRNTKEKWHAGCATVAIPDDLIHDLLLRLPAKSVGRFRCISKRWLSLATDPGFVHDHASSAPITGYIPHPVDHTSHIPLDGADSLPDPSFPPRGKVRGGLIFSTRGLLLHHVEHGDDEETKTKTFYVCNPMTRQLITIPQPCNMFGWVFGHALALDPHEPSRFKVAVWEWEAPRTPNSCKLHVYSSTTRSWRALYQVEFEDSRGWQQRRAVSWNGSLVWPSERSSFLLLDAAEERVREVGQPKQRCCYLGESRGRLHFIGELSPWRKFVDIYEMESESTGWSKLYHHLDLRHLRGLYPDMTKNTAPEFVRFVRGESRKEDELLLVVYVGNTPGELGHKVVSFRPQSRICSTVVDRSSLLVVHSVTPHAHSLISL